MIQSAHFLQTEAWVRVQRALGRDVVTQSGDGWRYVAFIETGRFNRRLYAPYGPEISSPGAFLEALASLKKHGKRLDVDFIRIEPTGQVIASELVNLGLRKMHRRQPEHTQRIDVNRPFEDVLAEMSSSQRNRHRNYKKKGLLVHRSNNPADVEHLIRLLSEVSDRTGTQMHNAEYLRVQAQTLMPTGDATMYLVEYQGEIVSAALVYDDGDRRYYAHAASATGAKRLNPGVILVTQMIEDACAGPQREFDLYGVVPRESKTHPWYGFSEFKRSFGGKQHDFLGTWEYPLRPVRYLFYRGLKKLSN